jgi:FkbM family methyltransferase
VIQQAKGHSIMIDNTNDENSLKLGYLNGKVSREEFWSAINSSLNEARKLQQLLLDDAVSLELFRENLVLKYQLGNNEYLRLVIPKNDLRTASFTILANGNYESLLEDVIFELASSSNKFLDIGANMGFYSLGACLKKKNLKVLAFEPNPSIRKSLIENTKLNHVENNIDVSEFALSDFKGDATFSVPAFTGSGGGSLKNLHPEEGLPIEFSVKVEKLDNLRSQTVGADLFKIDVEGAEFQLIQGGIGTIEDEHPTIVVELLRKWMKPFQSSPQDVVDLLVRLGYICFAVGNSKLGQIELIDESTMETNFVFCHEENLEHLKLLKNIHREN